MSYGKYLGRVGIGRHIAQYIFLSRILSEKILGAVNVKKVRYIREYREGAIYRKILRKSRRKKGEKTENFEKPEKSRPYGQAPIMVLYSLYKSIVIIYHVYK